MKYDTKEGKENIILGFIIFLLLVVICALLYINGYININRDNNMDINTVMNFDGGTDYLSIELENLIPFVTTNNKEYKSAYQDGVVGINDINNDILLTKGVYSINKDTISSNELINIISNMYGRDLFIINKNFNVNGKNRCNFVDNEYICDEIEYNGILYKADRDIGNVSISDNYLYLDESILFYSEEEIDGIVHYNVYDSGLYENMVLSFTSEDVENDNLTFDEYINKHLTRRRVSYRSSFVINGDHYNWVGTEIL